MRSAFAVAALTILGAAVGHAQQRKAPPPVRKAGLTAKELQDIRDEVIGARAVVRHLMRQDRLSNDEVAYVEEEVNHPGRVPPAVAGKVDAGKLKTWMAREQVRAWRVAETNYQAALRKGPPREAAPANGKAGLSPKEEQDLRDEVIAARAVVRHLMWAEGFRADERSYVEEYVNRSGVVPPAVAGKVDAGKMTRWLTRAEARDWVAAEADYQTALRTGRLPERGGKLSSWSDGKGVSVEVVRVHLEPFRTATGHDTQMVCVDWTNTGRLPVRRVKATITAYDAAGNQIYSAPDYYIYTKSRKHTGITPGETYIEPVLKPESDESGHIILSLDGTPPARVAVKITRAMEVLPEE